MRSEGAGERRWSGFSTTLGLLAACMAACGEPAPADRDAGPDLPPGGGAGDSVTAPIDWVVDTLDLPRFRAFGWGRDTLWGIARGRLARSDLDTVDVLDPVAWGVFPKTGSNAVAWSNEQGLFVRDDGGVRQWLRPADRPSGEYTGPDVVWGPGSRALLLWVAEAGALLTVLDLDGSHRVLAARLPPGHHPSGQAIWLDEARIALAATAMASSRSAGPGEYRESGFRANLAILDLDADSIRLVTDVPDDTFLRPEGVLGDGSLLVAVGDRDRRDARHVRFDTRTWSERPHLDGPGRAYPCGDHIVLLRPADEQGAGESRWDATLHNAGGGAFPLGSYQGYDVRVLWTANCRSVVLAQESEARGLLTARVRAR